MLAIVSFTPRSFHAAAWARSIKLSLHFEPRILDRKILSCEKALTFPITSDYWRSNQAFKQNKESCFFRLKLDKNTFQCISFISFLFALDTVYYFEIWINKFCFQVKIYFDFLQIGGAIKSTLKFLDFCLSLFVFLHILAVSWRVFA